MVDNILNIGQDNKMIDSIKARPTLMALIDRIKREYYATPTKFPMEGD